MKYIVFDMEWNQTYGRERPLSFGRSLSGEIIEIGAVRLDEEFRAEAHFKTYVRPYFYRKLHSAVKRLTGIDKTMLQNAPIFPDVLDEFREFCTDDFVTLTWGDSDVPILRENIDAHSLPKWTAKNYNLQSIYMRQVGSKNCISLETAAEQLGIDATDVQFHDASCDAEITALIAGKIDTAKGISEYQTPIGELSDSDILAFEKVGGVVNLQKLRSDPRIRFTPCPECRKMMEAKRIIPHSSGKKLACLECPDHGKYLLRLRTHHVKEDIFNVNKSLFPWTEDVERVWLDRLAVADRKKEKFLARVRAKKNKKKEPDGAERSES